MNTSPTTPLSAAAHDLADRATSGIDRAREASDNVRRQLSEVGDRTTDYVQQEPVKALLLAAAAGAAGGLLVGWLARSRTAR